MEIVRLRAGHEPLARAAFAMMGQVFDEEPWVPLGDRYLADLLARPSVHAYAAVVEGDPVGGLVAHALPMTRDETVELLVYDLAVRTDHQRRGVGRALVQRLRDDAAAAGLGEVWVPADDDDLHALEFYRRIGGEAQAVTVFSWPAS